MSWNRWTRKLHRWGALVSAVPLLLVIVSGLLLQIKKQATWVQPPTLKGSGAPHIDWPQILAIAQQDDNANIQSWDDIDRLDVRPGKSLIKVQAVNHWELQIDWANGEILSSSYRRSDWIESLHDGSFFGDPVKLYIFLPSGLILLTLWFTGVYLWYLPIASQQKKKRRNATKGRQLNRDSDWDSDSSEGAPATPS